MTMKRLGSGMKEVRATAGREENVNMPWLLGPL
jgi:hypothetical protein